MQFTFMSRNNPQSIIEGRIGLVGYFFKIFGAIAILCIEWMPRIGSNAERLDVIAQVIAECDSKQYVSGYILLPTSIFRL